MAKHIIGYCFALVFLGASVGEARLGMQHDNRPDQQVLRERLDRLLEQATDFQERLEQRAQERLDADVFLRLDADAEEELRALLAEGGLLDARLDRAGLFADQQAALLQMLQRGRRLMSAQEQQ